MRVIDLRTDGIYKPEQYDAVGDGSSDDTAAFQSMIQDMPTRGAEASLGARPYKVHGLVIDKLVKFQGRGAGTVMVDEGNTRIITTAKTGVQISNPYHGIIYRDIAFEGPTDATSGSALDFGTTPDGPGRGFKVQDCSFKGYYNHINAMDNWGCNIRDTQFRWAVNNCVNIGCSSLLDAGDGTIEGCLFVPGLSNSNAAIYQVSAGGLRILNNKFNGNPIRFNYCYRGDLFSDDAPAGTSILIATGNSFENYAVMAMYVEGVGTNKYGLVTIGDNEFAAYFGASTCDIHLKNVETFSVIGNVMRTEHTPGESILIENSLNGTLLNTYEGYLNPVTLLNSTNIRNLNVAV